MSTLLILLDEVAATASTAESTGAAQQSQWSGILMIIALIAIFYFMMIRPQQKKQKEIRKFREGLKVGDKVITAGGIYGKITTVGDSWFIIEIDKGVSIKIDKGSIYASPNDVAAENEKK